MKTVPQRLELVDYDIGLSLSEDSSDDELLFTSRVVGEPKKSPLFQMEAKSGDMDVEEPKKSPLLQVEAKSGDADVGETKQSPLPQVQTKSGDSDVGESKKLPLLQIEAKSGDTHVGEPKKSPLLQIEVISGTTETTDVGEPKKLPLLQIEAKSGDTEVKFGFEQEDLLSPPPAKMSRMEVEPVASPPKTATEQNKKARPSRARTSGSGNVSVIKSSRPVRTVRTTPNQRFTPGSPRVRVATRESNSYMKSCWVILRELFSKKHADYAYPFYTPVDPVACNIPDYLDVIKNPMDLGTIEGKMKKRAYKTNAAFARDVRLMFNNCFKYNAPDEEICRMAKKLSDVFEARYHKVVAEEGSGETSSEDEEEEDVTDDSESDTESKLNCDRQIPLLQQQIAAMRQQVDVLLESARRRIARRTLRKMQHNTSAST